MHRGVPSTDTYPLVIFLYISVIMLSNIDSQPGKTRDDVSMILDDTRIVVLFKYYYAVTR